jgi:hypothetical protein
MKQQFFVLVVMIFLLTLFAPMLFAGWNATTVPDSTYVYFHKTAYSKLTYTINTTGSYPSTDAYINFSISKVGYDCCTRYLKIYVDNVQVNTDNEYISGNYAAQINVPELEPNGIHTITFQINWGGYGDKIYRLNYLKIGRLYWNQNLDKIAVFFYHRYEDGGVVPDSSIQHYIANLQDEGYTVITHPNPADWPWDMNNLDAMEDENSIVLIYIAGHGNYNPAFFIWPDYSQVFVNNDYSIRSDTFASYVQNLESQNIMVVVEACQSGDFVHKLNMYGVNAITSTDEVHNSYGIFPPGFSEFFLGDIDYLDANWNDFILFQRACEQISYNGQNPQASWRANHSFFGPGYKYKD